MPVYAAGKAIALYPGDQGLAFGTIAAYSTTVVGEAQPQTGTVSQAFVIAPNNFIPDNAPSFSLALTFSGNPGAFNFQIQDADTDADSEYITLPTGGTITGPAVNQSGGTYVWRSEFIGVTKGMFVRLKIVSQTANVVTLIAKFTR